jgi:ribose/xylose/arabinose/galactoside ABC-type transport system permease subunit
VLRDAATIGIAAWAMTLIIISGSKSGGRK